MSTSIYTHRLRQRCPSHSICMHVVFAKICELRRPNRVRFQSVMFQNQVQCVINAILCSTYLTVELQSRLACCTPPQGRHAKSSRHELLLDLIIPGKPAGLRMRRDFASGRQVCCKKSKKHSDISVVAGSFDIDFISYTG